MSTREIRCRFTQTLVPEYTRRAYFRFSPAKYKRSLVVKGVSSACRDDESSCYFVTSRLNSSPEIVFCQNEVFFPDWSFISKNPTLTKDLVALNLFTLKETLQNQNQSIHKLLSATPLNGQL